MPVNSKYVFVVNMDVDADKEVLFNEIYDTEHIPNIMELDGVLQVIRFRDAERTSAGWLRYSALYLVTQADLPGTPEWRAKSDLGRWAPVIRPRVKARRQRLGRIMANAAKASR